MPRKRHSDKRRHEVTPEVRVAALNLHSWQRYWGGAAEGREAWAVLGAGWATGHSLLRTNVTTWPAPFWGYTSGIPQEYRALADEMEPIVALRIDAMRWLLGEGGKHLRPNEWPALEERLAQLVQEAALDDDGDDVADDGEDDGDDPDPDDDALWEAGR